VHHHPEADGNLCVPILLLHLSGDPAALLAPPGSSAAEIAELRHRLGLGQPLLGRYVSFLANAARGNFGISFIQGVPALWVAISRFPATLQLTVAALLFGWTAGLGLGITAAVWRRGPLDFFASAVAVVGQGMPVFWFGLLLIFIFAVRWHVLPSSGYGSPQNLVLPAITLGAVSMAGVARLARSTLIDQISQDYVRTATAKGLWRRRILLHHVGRNAAIPVVTLMALDLGQLLGGAVITETIFAWPGVGQLAVNSIGSRDFPVVQAIVVLVSIAYALIIMAAELSYAWIDPRIRFE
jgi:peptide/nickel transport system permease protein